MDEQINYYWEEAKKLLKLELTEVTMNTWIEKLTPLYFDDESFVLQSVDDMSKEIIEKRYFVSITSIVRAITEKDFTLKIISKNEDKTNSAIKLFENIPKDKTHLKGRYVFETFVKGKSNELAFAASVAVSESPGKNNYNPLFIYGGVGLGKTHLMHSIGNRVLEENPNLEVLYCSSETFTNELINSIRERKNQEFRNKYRDIDVLLIDDIQFLSDKEGTQEEFFHTFNTLYDANKQIVISSDQPPKELKTLEDRLRSRFGCGLIADISSPEFETRVAIVEKKAELDNVIISKEVTNFIAKNIVSNIRELEGALNKVVAFSTLSKNPITLELAERALHDIISENEKPEITVSYIQDIVANFYNVTPDDLRSKRRTQNVTYPRQIAMYLSRKLIDISLPKIGDAFGGRDHSTVIHACDKISNEIEKDKDTSSTIQEIEKKITGE